MHLQKKKQALANDIITITCGNCIKFNMMRYEYPDGEA